MNYNDMEGQMDFLGLISEYTDDQGAKVRIREPGKKRSKPIPPPEFEQITMDFEKVRAADHEKGDVLFKQCKKCWCFDCRHNKRNEAVPRDFGGVSMPCPACEGCVTEDMATICEIGNAKEGCMTRALEEGIVIENEYIE